MSGKNKFKVKFISTSKLEFTGKNCIQTIVETIENLNVKGLKSVLVDRLDLAIYPGGEPYRPEVEDIKSSLGKYVQYADKELKKETKRYQLAYDAYKSIIDVIDVITEIKEMGTLTTEFKPFSMHIEISVQ